MVRWELGSSSVDKLEVKTITAVSWLPWHATEKKGAGLKFGWGQDEWAVLVDGKDSNMFKF